MATRDNRINRELRGFLDSFRAKVGGQAPDIFSKEVRPVIDAQQFIAVSGMVTASAFNAYGSATAKTAATVTVPSDEVWLLHQANASCETADVANAMVIPIRLALGNVPTSGGGGTAEANLGGAVMNKAATDVGFADFTWTPGKPFLLGPDYTVLCKQLASVIAAGTVTYRAYALVTKYKV